MAPPTAQTKSRRFPSNFSLNQVGAVIGVCFTVAAAFYAYDTRISVLEAAAVLHEERLDKLEDKASILLADHAEFKKHTTGAEDDISRNEDRIHDLEAALADLKHQLATK